ncbi:Chondroitin AC/alginate lyase [Mycena indigotica]|uniref:Chondroitin AC/alginate lyase n=1 Tax=Mycena indigotica TaxID=2126181 RepID=A0A8H6SSZ3_9AGAR|nr:Chondroitin AC/alginate lyase [Mycena indigotica]KAF7304136.1 Chondroitin AC/alginate lyase [Mycena indigotica]
MSPSTPSLLRLSLLSQLLIFSSPIWAANPFVQYANDFIDPGYIAGLNGKYPASLKSAQNTIVAWAEELNSHGPWSVTFKPVVAPSNDKHDYMSWAPYQWPDCSSVKNTTVLTPAEIRTTCPYVNRDGQVNPDRSIPNDFQSFFNVSDAVLYNSLASTFQAGSAGKYQANAVKYIKTWFLDEATAMNPNLKYAQMRLGPTGQLGTFTGILDLRMMAKVVSGVLILRETKAAAWTQDIDSAFVKWCKAYINWLQTAPTAQEARDAKNNHGTFFAGQFMALQVLVGDNDGAAKTGRAYFDGEFKNQIAADGDQPLEATRTHPYHYRGFNIAGMITAARLLKYADPSSNVWQTSSLAPGATIQKAVDFFMSTDPAKSGETDVTYEIYPNVAAVAATYGDADGKYIDFLKKSGFPYAGDAFFLWDQPLGVRTGSGVSSAAVSRSSLPSHSAPQPSSSATSSTGPRPPATGSGNSVGSSGQGGAPADNTSPNNNAGGAPGRSASGRSASSMLGLWVGVVGAVIGLL